MRKIIIPVLILTFISNLIYAQQAKIIDAFEHLQSNKKDFALKQSDFNNAFVTDEYVSKEIKHSYYNQTKNDVPIFGKVMSVVEKDGEIKYVSENYIPLEKYNARSFNVGLDIDKALSSAAGILSKNYDFDYEIITSFNQNKVLVKSKSVSGEEIFIEKAYVVSGKDLIPAWLVGIYIDAEKRWEQMQIDIDTNQKIGATSWTIECSFDSCGAKHNHKHHKNEECGEIENASRGMITNGYEVFAMPLMAPNEGGRTIVNDPWSPALNASPFGWHDTNGAAGAEFTITRGNNVYATEDTNNDNSPGYAPDGGASLDFIFPLDLNDPPLDYWDASITNLFYWNNIMHDVFYQYGFDEASGNFQENNYGNGGTGSDSVNADAQDGSGTGNANFSPLPEGSNPRMQMFLWNPVGGAELEINSPAGIAGNYTATSANFGPQSGNWTGDLVVADPLEACSAFNNSGAITGNIAILDRGNCTFVEKVNFAQDAGAIAVIVCNNVAGAPITMGGSDGGITIPSIMISQADCNTIKANLPANASISVGYTFAYDSDFDNGVIAHEYGHGISTRLTGGPANSSCLGNDEQMGEGWSDWFGLMVTMESGDVGTDSRGVGTFLINQAASGSGIRQYPYTTDMTVNPHTYNNIGSVSIPHGVGSVWCAMLWELTWGLIAQHGFDPDVYSGTGGNNIAMNLVMEGLKIQPCSPGFIDGRDAILAADDLLYGGVNNCIIWEAFAKRGLGYNASQGSSGSASDGTQNFDLSPQCNSEIVLIKTGPEFSAVSSPLSYTIDVTNFTGGSLSSVNITDNVPPTTTYSPGSLTQGSESGGVITVDQALMADQANINFSFDLTNDGTDYSDLKYYQDFEYDFSDWAATTGQGSDGFNLVSTGTYRGSGAFFVANVGADNTQFLTSAASILPANALFTVQHRYDTETGWDGGLIEISTDGGTNWIDLGSNMIINPYNGSLGSSSNADIAGRAGFTGNSGGYVRTWIDLSSYAGQSAQIRFVFGSDNNTFNTGWFVDEIMIYEAHIVTNTACVSTAEGPNACDDVTTFIMPDCEAYNRYFADADGDGFGDINVEYFSCTLEAGYATDNTDCDDTQGTNFPGNTEICGDGIDNNCDGVADEGCPVNDNDCDGLNVNVLAVVTQPSYKAKEYLYTDAKVVNGQMNIMTAGDELDIDVGFEVELGADYHGYIDDCDLVPPVAPQNEEEKH